MKNVDLVITSDTAVAHVAGSLGVPVWVALPFAPDWRWLLDRTDSPWYPTICRPFPAEVTRRLDRGVRRNRRGVAHQAAADGARVDRKSAILNPQS